MVDNAAVGIFAKIESGGAATVKVQRIAAAQPVQGGGKLVQGHSLRLLGAAVHHEQEHRAVGPDAHSRAVVALVDKGEVVAHRLQRVVIDQERPGGHYIAVGQHTLPQAGTVGAQDAGPAIAQHHRAVLVILAVHRVLARRVDAILHPINAQMTDGIVPVHIEK